MFVIRKRIQLDAAKTIYLFVEQMNSGKKSFILAKTRQVIFGLFKKSEGWRKVEKENYMCIEKERE